jgi:hypothetical protein
MAPILTHQIGSRARWWTANVVAALLPALAGALLLTLTTEWALTPFRVLYRQGRIEPLDFEVHGIWPLTAVLVTFSLAALFGTVVRSSIAVVVATVLCWLAVFAARLYTRYDVLPPSVLTTRSASTPAPSTSTACPVKSFTATRTAV